MFTTYEKRWQRLEESITKLGGETHFPSDLAYLKAEQRALYAQWRKEWLDTFNAMLAGGASDSEGQEQADAMHGVLPEMPT